MKVVSFEICPFVQRVTAILELKEIPYEVEFISLSDKPDWFLEISPHGQVPLLITGEGEVLFESDAIAEYLEDTATPSLLSEDPAARARDRAWSYLASKNYLAQCSAQRSPDRETLDQRAQMLSKAFAKMERRFPDSPYFHGERPGMVDATWLPLLHRADIIERESGYDFLAEFPKLKAWQRRIASTGLPERTVSETFDAKFRAFYLSERTYLGG